MFRRVGPTAGATGIGANMTAKPDASELSHREERFDTYRALAAPFETTFRDSRGGIELEYITGEQVITRLNDALGVGGWSFRVLEHGIHHEADEAWILAEISATIDGAIVVRQQFGSQKIKRSRSSNAPLDVGFDLKGATTDALKKCASLLGVGLYLSKKETPGESAEHDATAPTHAPDDHAEGEPIVCADCGEELSETRFKDGTRWSPARLAAYGRRKHGRPLCMAHYREANDAVRRGQSLEARAS
ncbi:MAG TPA: Rad52/Rad22 family DNA repair protein [Chloroflexota bacterium]|nr:Rad52/Rad22 family DNA repair protein [Chloroflexota bacterium]